MVNKQGFMFLKFLKILQDHDHRLRHFEIPNVNSTHMTFVSRHQAFKVSFRSFGQLAGSCTFFRDGVRILPEIGYNTPSLLLRR